MLSVPPSSQPVRIADDLKDRSSTPEYTAASGSAAHPRLHADTTTLPRWQRIYWFYRPFREKRANFNENRVSASFHHVLHRRSPSAPSPDHLAKCAFRSVFFMHVYQVCNPVTHPLGQEPQFNRPPTWQRQQKLS